MQSLDLRSRLFSYGKAHFWFDTGKEKIAYCYIRKNACSAVKRLICETSQEADFKSFDGTELQFMEKYHRIRSVPLLDSCKNTIFIYRDPYERVISTYVNKFVVQTGNAAIFADYKKVTGSDPQKATFRQFVMDYCREFKDRDIHLYPQNRHLLPIRYDGVFSIDSLYDGMVDLLGNELADQYFKRKINSSEYGSEVSDKCDLSCASLHATYKETGVLPSKDCFQDDFLKRAIKNRYAADYKMIENIE